MRKIFQEFGVITHVPGTTMFANGLEQQQIKLVDVAAINRLYEALIEEEATPELLKKGIDTEAIRKEIHTLLMPAIDLQMGLVQKQIEIEKKQEAVRKRYQEVKAEMKEAYEVLEAFLVEASEARLQNEYQGVIKVRGMLRTMSRGYA